MKNKGFDVFLSLVWALIVSVVVALSVDATFLHYIGIHNPEYKTNYHKVWATGAITSVFIFGLLYDFSKTIYIKRHLSGQALKDSVGSYMAWAGFSGVLFLVVGAYVGFKIFDLFRPLNDLEEIEKYHAQQLAQLILVLSFTIFDLNLRKSLNTSLNEKGLPPTEISHLKEEVQLLKKMIWYVDIPSCLAFGFMLLYYGSCSHCFDKYFHNFIGGAEAFALVSFNIIYIMIIFKK